MATLESRPRVHSIPTGVSFVDALAASLIERHGGEALGLSGVEILLPNRRSVRTLREAFLRAAQGRALLLPRLGAVGDVDEDALTVAADAADALDLPPAMDEARRDFLLSRLVLAHRRRMGEEMAPAAALKLARELARLIDSVHTERRDMAGLAEIVPDDLARHWQITLDFLTIVTQSWPEILADAGALDPGDRRNRLIDGRVARWRADPPGHPVIAAGTTGSIPATADLLTLVARLPQGAVVLPGFDADIDEESWEALHEEPGHPQHMMRRLLDHMGVSRHEVEPWPLDAARRAALTGRGPRIDLVKQALRPAATVSAWRSLDLDRKAAARGLSRIDCAGAREEAGVIALLMRECLETPGKTAALVTPDRRLARQVSAELERWGVAVDDSAGTPLAASVPGAFLRLIGRAAADGFGPVSLLALLKHPLAAAGRAPMRLRGLARTLDRHRKSGTFLLRGPRPTPGLEGLLSAAAALELGEPHRSDLARLCDLLRPMQAMIAAPEQSLAAALEAHLSVAEALAATGEAAGAERLWRGEAGEALSRTIADIRAAAEDVPAFAGDAYPAFFEALIAPHAVRPRFGRHPRLAILGTIEARLHHADLMILGGLNEGTWPPAPAHDPWMSRQMRARFGLAPLERRAGQSAHDFLQACGAAEVVLTRAAKLEGAETVPSRWLSRLAVAGPALPSRPALKGWHRALDDPGPPRPCDPPRPAPPVAARPDKFSVTQVELWMRDPYALYAKKVLRLEPLDDLEADPGALERGNVIHDALDRYMRSEDRPDNREAALKALIACGRTAFGAHLARPSVWAFWWPRFVRVAHWFVDHQAARAGRFETLATEIKGRLKVPGHGFTLTAKADRIDRRIADGRLEIVDYKTGGPPSARQIEAGFAPQLPLEGWMAAQGAFAGLEPAETGALSYWQLKGTRDPAVIRSVAQPEDKIAAAAAGLAGLIERFGRPSTPYLSNPRPAFAGYGDYDHLARVAEWTRLPDVEEAEEGW